MKEYEVVVENSTDQNVCKLVRETVEEIVHHASVSNSIVCVVRTSYIERLYDALNQTGLTYMIEEL
jgi:hypothetical protein